MPRKSRENKEIRDFILKNVEHHSSDIVHMTVNEFGLSRVAVNGYMRRLVERDLLHASGNTKARIYKPRFLVDEVFEIPLSAGSEEHIVWQFRILPLIKNVKENVIGLCEYGFTEILNNAIDHSVSKSALISLKQTHNKITMRIIDFGVGIFNKIQKDFSLADPREALLELTKGKLTSDPKRHAGQGIFFTSRMMDEFIIRSGYLFFIRERIKDDDWLIETEQKPDYTDGTAITMEIYTDTDRTQSEVFDQYQGKDLSFNKAHVPVKLSKYGGEHLVSRSQAKRVLARFEKFTEVFLDFRDVPEIGQAFADEIFRVFANAHPEVEVLATNATPEVQKMIDFVKAYKADEERKK